MTLPLPSGWVDTGITGTFTKSMNLQALIYFFGLFSAEGATDVRITLGNVGGTFSPWAFEVLLVNVSGVLSMQVQLTDYLASTTTAVEVHPVPSPPYGPSPTSPPYIFTQWTNVYALTETVGPYRLGVRYGGISGHNNFPMFVQDDYEMEYGWFADPSTVGNSTCAGYSSPPYYPAPSGVIGPVPPSGLPVGVTISGLYVLSAVCAHFTNITVDGVVIDASELNDGVLLGSGGSVDAYAPPTGGSTASSSFGVYPPYQFSYDLAVKKDGGPSAGAQIQDSFVVPTQTGKTYPQADYLTDGLVSYTIPVTSWATHYKVFNNPLSFAISSAWAAAQDPALETDDLALSIRGAPALMSPGARGQYNPVTLAIQETMEINRPDGNAPPDVSSWVTSDATKLTVTENSSNSQFVVTATGASVTRTLKTNWSNYITVGQPDYVIDGYRYLKHNRDPGQQVYPEDVWWWQTYGWMEFDITVPAACTLTMTVNYIDMDVFDPHTTGSDRQTDMVITQTSKSVTFTIPLVSGSNPDVSVDLLFPNGGGPVYIGRVTSIELSGFAVGTTTLNSIIITAESGPYVKFGFGVPVQRTDYSVPVLAMDGSFVLGNEPDQAYKPDEIGNHGGSLRFVEPVTGSVTGTISDYQMSLEAFWAQLNEVEGITAIYDGSAFDAANTDVFGSSLGPELSQWLWDVLPYQTGTLVSGNYVLQPPCSPVCRQVSITSGLKYVLYVEGSVWGGLESIVCVGGVRAPEGILINAVDVSTGEIYASGVTDEQGYLIVTPVPANTSAVYGLSTG